MKKIYFTVCGTKYFLGQDFIEKGDEVLLEKEKDNEIDSEAIVVKMEGLGKIGHVANSVYTRIGESYSAGRLYDKIGDQATGKVLRILEKGILCVLIQEEE